MDDRKPVNLRCTKCGHIWTAAHTPMPLAEFAKAMKAVTCPACGAEPKQLAIAPVRDLAMLDKFTRAICAETCAYYGDPPCHSIEGPFPPASCDEPGCQAAAMAVLRLIEATDGPAPPPPPPPLPDWPGKVQKNG